MRTSYCNGYIGELMENVAEHFYLSGDKALIKLIEFLLNEAFTFGWKFFFLHLIQNNLLHNVMKP